MADGWSEWKSDQPSEVVKKPVGNHVLVVKENRYGLRWNQLAGMILECNYHWIGCNETGWLWILVVVNLWRLTKKMWSNQQKSIFTDCQEASRQIIRKKPGEKHLWLWKMPRLPFGDHCWLWITSWQPLLAVNIQLATIAGCEYPVGNHAHQRISHPATPHCGGIQDR